MSNDLPKFDKARRLHNKIDLIREAYMRDLNSTNVFIQQRAVALYLIDTLLIRVGHETGDQEANVGCCTLKCKHVTLKPNNVVKFDFIGKSNVRFLRELPVNELVYKHLENFKRNKQDNDKLFDNLNATQLNEYLGTKMDGE